MNIKPLTAALCATVLAMAALPAHAQSTVKIYGLLDLSAGRTQAPGGAANNGVESGKMTTSFFGVQGDEDLGGGLKATFALEHFLRADTGSAGRFDTDTFWARNAYVGVGGGFGTVTLGRVTTALFVNTLLFNAFGDSFGFSPSIRHVFTSSRAPRTQATDTQVSGDTGWSDSVKYSSPKFGGLSFTAQAALGEGVGGRNIGLSALYFGGPLAAGFSWQKVEKGTGPFNADTNSWQLGGSYALAPFKLYGQYSQVKNTSLNNTIKIIGLGGDMVVGQVGKVMLQWGKLNPDVGADRTTLSLGYDHQLSKRTDLYAVYMSDKLSGLASGNNYSVGVRHRF